MDVSGKKINALSKKVINVFIGEDGLDIVDVMTVMVATSVSLCETLAHYEGKRFENIVDLFKRGMDFAVARKKDNAGDEEEA